MSGDRRALLGGIAATLVLALFVALRLDVRTDVTHFLPDAADATDVHLARELADGELSRTLVLLVDAPDAATAASASRAFEAALHDEPAVADGTVRLVAGTPDGLEQAIWQLYAPHRTAFLAADADASQAMLTDEALREAARELKRALGTPMSTFLSRVVPQDPLRVLPKLFERLVGDRGAGLKVVDGRFVTADERAAVLFLTTRTGASDPSATGPLLDGVERAFEAAKQTVAAPVSLAMSGSHLFARSAEHQIRADIQRVSIGSAVGLVLLFVLLFRSLRLVGQVLPILLVGFLGGTAACLACFGSIHGLTLAFGAALIGVSVDYGVHFHCHQLLAPAAGGPRRTLRSIWPGLLLGAGTTVTGFVALMLSSFPGLRQLAVFAAAGVACAALSTWLFLPALAGPARAPTALAKALVRGLGALLFAPGRHRAWLAAPAAAAALCAAVGLPQLRWNDAIADLNRIDPEVARVDRAVRARVVRYEQRRLVVATGADEEQALVANDRVAAVLDRLQQEGALRGSRNVASLLPSAARQRAVDAVVRGDQGLATRLSAAFAAEDFRPEAFAPFWEHLAAPPPPPLTFDALAASPLAAMVAPFRFTWSGGVGFASFLDDLRDEPALRAALDAVPGARLIDIEGTLSAAYGAYRARLFELWLVGLAAVLGLVWLRHRRLRPTLVAYAPAMLAAAATLGLLSLCGVEANMLSLVALLMVVGMGVDYGVFLAEHGDDPARRDATLLAVVLAAVSTALGFGLLSLSSQPPLFHIGLTSGTGVLLCLVLAPTIAALASRRPDR